MGDCTRHHRIGLGKSVWMVRADGTNHGRCRWSETSVGSVGPDPIRSPCPTEDKNLQNPDKNPSSLSEGSGREMSIPRRPEPRKQTQTRPKPRPKPRQEKPQTPIDRVSMFEFRTIRNPAQSASLTPQDPQGTIAMPATATNGNIRWNRCRPGDGCMPTPRVQRPQLCVHGRRRV